jgi:hypothetical protein
MFPLHKRLHWARRAAQAQILFSLVLFVVAYLALVRTTPFFVGLGDALADAAGRTQFSAEVLGAISGPLLMSVCIAAIVLIALQRRTRMWAGAAYVLLGLQVCSAFAMGGVAIFALLMLGCLASREAWEHLCASGVVQSTSSPARRQD